MASSELLAFCNRLRVDLYTRRIMLNNTPEESTMPTVNLPDRALFYAQSKPEHTAIPPLILVHGAGGSRLDWPPGLRRLPGMHVIAPDLAGHGRSQGPAHDDTRAHADDIIAFMDLLEIERAIIAGHSMGGAIALQIGIHAPARAAGLILIGTGSKLPVDPTLPQRIMDETDATIDWITEWAWSDHAPDDLKALGREQLANTPPATLHADYRACQVYDVRAHVAQVTAPALVIGAENDRMVPLKFSVTLADTIPDATLIVIENAGHMIPLEQPDKVTRSIADWLANLS